MHNTYIKRMNYAHTLTIIECACMQPLCNHFTVLTCKRVLTKDSLVAKQALHAYCVATFKDAVFAKLALSLARLLGQNVVAVDTAKLDLAIFA